jgi:hypothetical protein
VGQHIWVDLRTSDFQVANEVTNNSRGRIRYIGGLDSLALVPLETNVHQIPMEIFASASS